MNLPIKLTVQNTKMTPKLPTRPFLRTAVSNNVQFYMVAIAYLWDADIVERSS
jgi:hypothetical protein